MRKTLIAGILLLLAPFLHAATLDPPALRQTDSGFLLRDAWKYHAGDDPAYAKPDLDDSAWQTPKDTLDVPPGWNGAGWFRLRLTVSPDLVSVPLALSIRTAGKLDLYINGKKTAALDRTHLLQLNPEVIALPSQQVVLAVRYENPDPDYYSNRAFYSGIALWIGSWEIIATRIQHAAKHLTLLAGILLSFTFLHFVLFLFHRDEKLNLFLSALTFFMALLVLTELQDAMIHRLAVIWVRRLWAIGMFGTGLASVRFTYQLRDGRVPRRFAVMAAAGAGVLVWGWNRLDGGWIDPAGAEHYVSLLLLLFLLDMGYTFVAAMRKSPSETTRILGLGSLPLLITGLHQLLINFGIARPLLPFFKDVPLPYYSILVLVGSMSVHLSRSFARTNRELQQQLAQVKELSEQRLEQERKAQQQEMERRLLEADNRRKTAELEEARRLQLSMLPRNVPLIPGLEACFYMKTATEVGGDYYDFYRNSDNELTIAVGDATGHGMHAGTMVAAVKGLFQHMAGEQDLAELLAKMSTVLKRMNLGRMYMALTVARFQENRARLASAGMPPPLLYRAADKQMEEIRLRGIWLGGARFAYEQAEIVMEPGDTLLLMSDGYPEMFNAAGEILGYNRARSSFHAAAAERAGQVISNMVRTGEEWAAGHPLQDDVTFSLVRFAADRGACFPCSIEISGAEKHDVID